MWCFRYDQKIYSKIELQTNNVFQLKTFQKNVNNEKYFLELNNIRKTKALRILRKYTKLQDKCIS